MVQDIYDPLDEFASVFQGKFRQVAEQTFDLLAQEAGIDAKSNQQTCRELYQAQTEQSKLKSRLSGRKVLCGLLWTAIALAIVLIITMREQWERYHLLLAGVVAIVALLLIFLVVMPQIQSLKELLGNITKKVEKLQTDAWEQLAKLNELFDWDILTRMMTQTVPRLEFDPYFTTQRLADLERTYGWDGTFNEDRSVVYAHSGLINGNPFVICRTKKMEMGEKTYYGSKVISWTTIERDSKGHTYTQRHTQTLTAHVTAPYPGYYEHTRVIYGNTAAPDLIFSRIDNDLAGRERSLAYKWERRKLRKKMRDLEHSDYAMMANEEFEVLFNTSDRNNNQQFALLFTPLAQQSMLKLMRDEQIGYGDDFDFLKNKMINTILPQHMQEINLDLNPKQYQHFDYEKAKKNFINKNQEYFRAIYFSLAPLLCVPMYQQIRPAEAIYGRDMKRRSAFWEHEALANFWGTKKFQHPDCVTDCILKTERTELSDNQAQITVTAYGFRSVSRITYVSVYGGDGRWHQVPVHWDEYLPVTGKGQLQIEDDNHVEETGTTPRQRQERIQHMLQRANYRYYRRHIASKV